MILNKLGLFYPMGIINYFTYFFILTSSTPLSGVSVALIENYITTVFLSGAKISVADIRVEKATTHHSFNTIVSFAIELIEPNMHLSQKQQTVINNTVQFVKTTLQNAEGGHDWWHIFRVWKLSIHIAYEEKANQFIVQLGALLHDIADPKFNNGDEETGPDQAARFLSDQQVEPEIREAVDLIIRHISFKNSFDKVPVDLTELKIVQDADRLDAMGAIGIARTFNYGGYKNFSIYDPNIKPKKYRSKEEYKKSDAPTINHFYEKLLLLRNMMNTATGKRLASGRHEFMEQFLSQFFEEWEGKR